MVSYLQPLLQHPYCPGAFVGCAEETQGPPSLRVSAYQVANATTPPSLHHNTHNITLLDLFTVTHRSNVISFIAKQHRKDILYHLRYTFSVLSDLMYTIFGRVECCVSCINYLSLSYYCSLYPFSSPPSHPSFFKFFFIIIYL